MSNKKLKRGDTRVQVKRIKYQIKRAFETGQEPFPLIIKPKQFETKLDKQKIQKIIDFKNSSYKLIQISFEIDYPNYKQINKKNPRYKVYQMRYLFGVE